MESFNIRAALRIAATLLILGLPQLLGGQEAALPRANLDRAELHRFPDVVARVNGAAIQKNELVRRVEAMRERVGLPEGDLPVEIYRTVLSDLVDIELLYQASRSRGFQATAAEVDEEVEELRSQFPSDEAFRDQLAVEEMTADQLREILRKDLSVQKLVERELLPKVFITDGEKRRFYDENLDAMRKPEQLRLRHILARVAEGASSEEKASAREKVAGLRKEIVEEGADFATLARQHSDDVGSREDGGLLTVARGQTVEAFERAAFGLEPGTVSEVVQTPFGYHIIQVSERIPEGQVSYEEAESRIHEYLQRELLHSVISAELETLRSEADIELSI